MKTVPILVYHSISNDPPTWIRSFSVTPAVFERQLELIVEAGATTLSMSAFADAIAGRSALPKRAVVITFDDGLSDFRDEALPALHEKGLTTTLYVTTGFLDDFAPHSAIPRPAGRWLDTRALLKLRDDGVEIGGHSHTHPQLDTLAREAARHEVASCKAILEQLLQESVRSFAYPHGYFSRSVRRLVGESGYESACACKNALSSAEDDPLALARLMIRQTTSLAEFAAWLDGRGAPVAPRAESIRTRGWRAYRRGRAILQRTTRSDWKWGTSSDDRAA
jgi:peptidoglycan/xylan/chitin deacetylase (PgdA/CDA1 family)